MCSTEARHSQIVLVVVAMVGLVSCFIQLYRRVWNLVWVHTRNRLPKLSSHMKSESSFWNILRHTMPAWGALNFEVSTLNDVSPSRAVGVHEATFVVDKCTWIALGVVQAGRWWEGNFKNNSRCHSRKRCDAVSLSTLLITTLFVRIAQEFCTNCSRARFSCATVQSSRRKTARLISCTISVVGRFAPVSFRISCNSGIQMLTRMMFGRYHATIWSWISVPFILWAAIDNAVCPIHDLRGICVFRGLHGAVVITSEGFCTDVAIKAVLFSTQQTIRSFFVVYIEHKLVLVDMHATVVDIVKSGAEK